MKHRIDFGKYLIRFVGSVCILSAVILLVMAPIIQIDGVKNKELRSLYTQIEEVSKKEETWLLNAIERTGSLEKEDLEDNDLPCKKSDIKSWFGNINGIVKETLNDTISLKEVGVLIWNVPGMAQDVQNLVETDYVLDNVIAHLVVRSETAAVRKSLEEVAEYTDMIRMGGYLAFGVIALLALLVVHAVIGNLRNKGRGGKYVLFVIVLAIVAGGYIGLPLLTEPLQESLREVKILKEMELQLTIMPVFSCLLLIVPMILDGWNKKRTKRRQKKLEVLAERAAAESVVQAQPMVEKSAKPPMEVCEEERVQSPVEVCKEEHVQHAVTQMEETITPEMVAAACAERVKKLRKKIRIRIPENSILRKIAKKVWEKKKYIGIGAAAIGAVAVVVLLFVLGTNNYKTPVRVMQKQSNNKKFSTTYRQNQDLLNGLMKKETAEILDIMEQSGYYEDMMEEMEEAFEDSVEDLQDEYGSNYKYTYKIVEKEELEKADLRSFRNRLRKIGDSCEELEEETDDFESEDWEDVADELDLSKSKTKALVREVIAMGKVCKKVTVTKGYELTVEIRLTGSELDEPEEEEVTINVYKVNGRWITDLGVTLLEMFSYY